MNKENKDNFKVISGFYAEKYNEDSKACVNAEKAASQSDFEQKKEMKINMNMIMNSGNAKLKIASNSNNSKASDNKRNSDIVFLVKLVISKLFSSSNREVNYTMKKEDIFSTVYKNLSDLAYLTTTDVNANTLQETCTNKKQLKLKQNVDLSDNIVFYDKNFFSIELPLELSYYQFSYLMVYVQITIILDFRDRECFFKIKTFKLTYKMKKVEGIELENEETKGSYVTNVLEHIDERGMEFCEKLYLDDYIELSHIKSIVLNG